MGSYSLNKNQTKSFVLIIDPKSHIRKNPSVLARHVLYADELEIQSKKRKKLVILSIGSATNLKPQVNQSLIIIHLPILKVLTKERFSKYVEQQGLIGDVELVVSGDPWLGAFWSLVLKRVYFQRTRLQFQVHADLGSKIWQRMSLRNLVKVQIAKITLKRADQLRCVSNGQAKKISAFFNIEPGKIAIVPVVSILTRKIPTNKLVKQQQISLGFVGRIQKDRGLGAFIKIAKKLNSQRQDFGIVVAGSGPGHEKFLKELRVFIKDSRIIDFGEVSPNEMDGVWEKIGVLLSCPPAESFGRALREAIAQGVPIWVTPTTGAIEFVETLNPKFFRIVNSGMEPKEIEQQFSALVSASIPEEYAESLNKWNNGYVEELIQTWVKVSA